MTRQTVVKIRTMKTSRRRMQVITIMKTILQTMMPIPVAGMKQVIPRMKMTNRMKQVIAEMKIPFLMRQMIRKREMIHRINRQTTKESRIRLTKMTGKMRTTIRQMAPMMVQTIHQM